MKIFAGGISAENDTFAGVPSTLEDLHELRGREALMGRRPGRSPQLREPSDELKALLDRFGATYLRSFGDLQYWP
jgi:hypothetical protein